MDKGEAQIAQTEQANRFDDKAQERADANQAKADGSPAAIPVPQVKAVEATPPKRAEPR